MTQSASTPRLRATLLMYLALVAASTVIGPREVPVGFEALLRTCAFLLVALACFGRVWCSTFIAGYKDSQLVTAGPYAACRHPLYLLSFVGALGLALASRSWTLGALLLITLAALLSRAVRAEERFLAQKFPTDWPAYARSTPRWWPRWSQYAVPDTATVNPRVFWKSFVDAGAFALLYALTVAAVEVRSLGLLPWHLPWP